MGVIWDGESNSGLGFGLRSRLLILDLEYIFKDIAAILKYMRNLSNLIYF